MVMPCMCLSQCFHCVFHTLFCLCVYVFSVLFVWHWATSFLPLDSCGWHIWSSLPHRAPAVHKGWLISTWLRVEEDELYSSQSMNVQFDSDYAESLKLMTFVVFLFQEIENCISAMSEKICSLGLKGLRPEEDMVLILGEGTPYNRMVKKWSAEFKHGRRWKITPVLEGRPLTPHRRQQPSRRTKPSLTHNFGVWGQRAKPYFWASLPDTQRLASHSSYPDVLHH